jgi:hypothetical protein
MWQRKPKPDPRLAAFNGHVRVDASSPKWLHRVVYRCEKGLLDD